MPNKKSNPKVNPTKSKQRRPRTRSGKKANLPTKRAMMRRGGATSTKEGADFLRAALDPFADCSIPAVGVPDSYGGRSLKHCVQQSVIAKPDSNGSIAFIVVPTPEGAIGAIKGKFNFARPWVGWQGPNPPSAGSGLETGEFDTAELQGKAVGIIPYPDVADWMASNPENSYSDRDTYGTEAFRTVSVGAEWRYTGTSLTNQGKCYGARIPFHLKEGRQAILKPDPFVNSWHGNDTLAVQCKQVRQATIANLLSTDGSTLSRMPQTVIHDMREGGMSVGVCEDADWTMRDYSKAVLTSDTTAFLADNLGPIQPSYPELANAYTMGIWCGARDWHAADTIAANLKSFLAPIGGIGTQTPMAFSMEGLDPNASIEIRIKVYLERSLVQLSSFQSFTTKSPAADSAAINTVATVSKTFPTMVPVSMNGFGDWWKKIMGTISNLGKIVGGIGIPVVSQVAQGVGGIADILGSFASL